MTKTNTNPEVRFAGFSAEWQVKKAKELCLISTGKSNTQDNIKDGRYPFYVRSPIIERSNKFLFDEEAVLTVGDGVGTGKVHHYVNGKYDLHQRVYRMFDFKEVTGKYFYLFFSNNFHARVTAMTAKSSVDSVRLDMIAEMKIKYPEINEQKLIGNFFENIDKLITEHQQKHSKLKSLKQAMLDKMFPKQGQLVPEIRFKGFEGEWEECCLKEIANPITGYPFRSKQFTKEGILLVRGMNVKRGFLEVSSSVVEFWPSSMDVETFLLQENDIVIQMDGALIGKSYAKIQPKHLPALLVQRVTRLRGEIQNSELIYQYIQRDFLRYINSIKTETAVPHLSLNDIRDFRLSIPKSPIEKQKIGNFFKNLDELIANQETQIAKLQNLKKAFLAKMFI